VRVGATVGSEELDELGIHRVGGVPDADPLESHGLDRVRAGAILLAGRRSRNRLRRVDRDDQEEAVLCLVERDVPLGPPTRHRARDHGVLWVRDVEEPESTTPFREEADGEVPVARNKKGRAIADRSAVEHYRAAPPLRLLEGVSRRGILERGCSKSPIWQNGQPGSPRRPASALVR
jgi:hypothetical protein